jgi:tetratricopeptide (TPR) repeat protein
MRRSKFQDVEHFEDQRLGHLADTVVVQRAKRFGQPAPRTVEQQAAELRQPHRQLRPTRPAVGGAMHEHHRRSPTQLLHPHLALGAAYTAAGRYQEGKAAYERAIHLNPNLPAPVANVGAIYGRMGAHDRAVQWYRRALELDPRSVLAHAALSINYAILGFFPLAEEALEIALTLQPDLPLAAREYAVLVALLQDDFARAITEADLLVALHPEDPLALAIAGNTRLLAGEINTARRHLEQAHALSPMAGWVAPVPVLLGYVYLAEGETESGLRLLREYLLDAQAELNRIAVKRRLFRADLKPRELVGI